MKRAIRQFIGISAVMSILAALLIRADDVPVEKLPRAIVDSLKAKFPGYEITTAIAETEDNKLVYEISLKHNGANYDIIVTPEGKINVVEKAIDPKSLPKPVIDAVNKKYANAKVDLAEELSDGSGKITSYEVHLTTKDGKKVAIEFAPDGKLVSEE